MRASRDAVLVATAQLWAQRSTCSRLAVGAVIHSAGRILVQGYNGAPSGLAHCDHTCNCSPRHDGHHHDCKSGPAGCRATHAEQNAISWAAKMGVQLLASDMVVTHQPCINCARLIINCGIKSVLYVEDYRLKDGVDLLYEAGVKVTRWVADDDSRMVEYSG